MAIKQLTTFIPPPENPIENEGDWTLAETELGVRYPTDFKDLIGTYGTGEFYGDLVVENPLRKWGRNGIREYLNIYRELRDACEFSYAMFPETPGLFPWGGDSNGHLYCWWTAGEPDDWPIVQLFHGYEDDEMEIVPGPISCFLIDFMSNKYPNMLGGNTFSEEDHFFKVGVPGRNLEED